MTNDDLADVRRLVERYAWAVDDHDADGVVECFVPSGRFVGGDVVAEGHDAIRSFFTSALGDGSQTRASTHMMGNVAIDERSADRCVVRTAALVYHADIDSGRVVVRGVTYTDVCVRTTDGWRFEQRQHRLRWAGEMPGAAD